MYIINMIKELLCVKRQQFELSASYFNRHDIDCMIDICVLHSVIFSSFLLCVLTYNVIIIIIILQNITHKHVKIQCM